MRKFPKLLAIVLAIAIVICPAMCLTTMAETPVNGYSVEYANDVLTIKVTSDTGFMVSFIKVAINGFTVDEDNVTVATKEGIEFAANPSYEEGVLSLLLAAKEAADIDLVTEATVTVPAVPNEEVDSYYIALTNIQAADAGTAEAPESFLEFEGVTTETGAVENIVPTVDGALHECTAVEYVDNGDGTHNGICDCADATIVVENEDHIDEDADNACDLCDAELEVEDVCEHVWEYVTATPAEGTGSGDALANYTTTKPGSITIKCSVCDHEETQPVTYYGRPKCYTSNALYESAITLTFSARKDRMLKLGQYDEAFVRFAHVISSDGSLKETSQRVADGKDTVANNLERKTFEYPVKSLQLTEEIVTNVFIRVDGVWYSGESFGYSVRSYADEVLTYDTVEQSEKALIVNMLRYGAKMQILKNYNIENLADADLPAEYAALITETDPTIEGTPTYNAEIGNDCLQILPSTIRLFMDSRTEVLLRVRSDRYTADKYKDDFIIEAVWESAKATERSAKFYNVAYAPEDVTTTYGQDSASSNQGRWEFYFGECPAYDFRQVITFKLYDPEDQIDVGNEFSASFEQMINYVIAQGQCSDAEIEMYNAMMNYSDAAKAHFCK